MTGHESLMDDRDRPVGSTASDTSRATEAIVLTNLVSRRTRACWWLSRRLGGRSIFGKRDVRLYKQTVTKSADSPITEERPRDVGAPGAAT